jgi:hypothetical protein
MTQILKVPITQESMNRIAECETFIPYRDRNVSCTENASRMLGHITQDTFQQCARLQRDNPTPAQREAIESIYLVQPIILQ